MNSITDFFTLFLKLIKSFISLLNSKCIFTVFGYTIGYFDFLIGILIFSFIICVFWRGVRS